MNWINCFKEMPHKHENVLVWVIYKEGSTDFTESWLDDDGWAMGSAKGFKVTHWMRIEEPK